MSQEEIQNLKMQIKSLNAQKDLLSKRIVDLKEIKRILEPKAAKLKVAVDCVQNLEQLKNIVDRISPADLNMRSLDQFKSIKDIVDNLYERYGESITAEDMTIQIDQDV